VALHCLSLCAREYFSMDETAFSTWIRHLPGLRETMLELIDDVTIVIVTTTAQQAQRVSTQCVFLMRRASQGGIVEHGSIRGDVLVTD